MTIWEIGGFTVLGIVIVFFIGLMCLGIFSVYEQHQERLWQRKVEDARLRMEQETHELRGADDPTP